LAEWDAIAAPIEEPAHAPRGEIFIDGEPTQEFVSAMMSPKSASSPAPHEHGAKLPEEKKDGGTDKEDEVAERAPTPVDKCPKCGSNQVRESRPHTKFEYVISYFGIPTYRCHRCFHRYVVVSRFAFSKNVPPV
jgi:hypothetical protein